ncbi:Polyribonucleotide nucleotidyltransferase [Candidatus Annandia adelgestsuga]|uniref:Polyribonucleotide nucleotidyltransferase n=1 Tax=Candidatus Annandia adelgestsuga TaxID=1302411 RepID=A0A3Q9CKU5_9ENTR|nr:polyribonucleotide nucleotidyltransferase [Candidatus Annandia adelgestsuga]AZP36308.1 Polyribonucleotide nucleotidyltransferase [Candidatus Annandia adelgestsuga]
MSTYFIHKFKYGDHKIIIENGFISRKSTSSVVINMNNTIILVNIMCKKKKNKDNFFPLTIQYQEKAYSAGKIPGNFFRREGKSSENEILISRLIDRSIRPLFSNDYSYEIQIVATLISLNPEVNPDIVAIIGVSSALGISGISFKNTIGASKVGIIDNKYVLNPKISDMKKSNLDLILTSTKDSILMIESGSNILDEEKILESIKFLYEKQKILIDNINIFIKKVNKCHLFLHDYKIKDLYLLNIVKKMCEKLFIKTYLTKKKKDFYNTIKMIKKKSTKKLLNQLKEYNENEIKYVINKIEKKTLRKMILKNKLRVDNRKINTVRKLNMGINFIPNTHGSSFFTRGKTQSIVTITLGTSRDSQNQDELYGEKISNSFIFHYNFPSYAVGEIGILGAPKRREIGHGRLARKSFLYLIPKLENFPYTIRVVSEITESDGSSSMASVCGASLALMDAGVPIKHTVSGISMGLIKNKNKYVVLTDITGYEDYIGDIDFKSSGTINGITSLQMDVKNKGINLKILKIIFKKSRKARIYVISCMKRIIGQHRKNISKNAPHICKLEIDPKKIKDVIGKGGSVIKKITEMTDSQIDIENNGTIMISASNNKKTKEAIDYIKKITTDIIVNNVYCGIISKIVNFGIFVKIDDTEKEGLVHISHISDKRINNINDYLSVGQKIYTKVLEVDRTGRIRLSIKEAKKENLLNKIKLPN